MKNKNKIFPNFICVGAQKAGSSSLYKLLRSHPEIHVSEQKEIHFFDIEREYEKGINHYLSFFQENFNNQKVIGEFTPDYFQYSFIPKRILDDLGKIKILIILRHPVDRAYSQFNFHKMWKHESKNKKFENELELESIPPAITERIKWYFPAYYKTKSLYYHQVKQYYDTFGRENVHIIIFEEMLRNKNEPNLKSTCEFLGVNPNYHFKTDHSNPTIMNFDSGYVKLLRKVKNVLLTLFPKKIILPLKDYIVKKVYQTPEKLSLKRKEKLFNLHFKEDVKRLEELTQLNLSIWK